MVRTTSRVLATAAALLPMLVMRIPVFAYPNGMFVSENLTLGRILEYDQGFIHVGAISVLAVLAASAWLHRAGWAWAIVAWVTPLVMLVTAVLLGLDSQIFWDGTDPWGRPTGGVEVAEPSLGLAFEAFATVFMISAGVLALVARAQERRPQLATVRG